MCIHCKSHICKSHICKSLWIKASAKYVNVNVNTSGFLGRNANLPGSIRGRTHTYDRRYLCSPLYMGACRESGFLRGSESTRHPRTSVMTGCLLFRDLMYTPTTLTFAI